MRKMVRGYGRKRLSGQRTRRANATELTSTAETIFWSPTCSRIATCPGRAGTSRTPARAPRSGPAATARTAASALEERELEAEQERGAVRQGCQDQVQAHNERPAILEDRGLQAHRRTPIQFSISVSARSRPTFAGFDSRNTTATPASAAPAARAGSGPPRRVPTGRAEYPRAPQRHRGERRQVEEPALYRSEVRAMIANDSRRRT